MMIPTQVKPIDSAQNITIHLIGAYNSTITMSSFDSVNDIANVVNAQDSFYISNGRILSPAFSLSFQGIKDGDTIHVLKKKTKPEKMYVVRENYQLENDVISKLRERFDKGWAHKFKDPDAVFEQLRDASNPTTAGESSRLSDLFKTRIETNPAAYKKVCMRYRKELEGDPKIQSSLPTVLPLKSNSPSIQMLPTNWSKSPLANSPQETSTR
ncbi:hypothetical protein GPJ56_008735 [Histomonas meleagridis]|uniref:uncharacterized protein n=1 Tax=Histomonas meleagridis TaxID=135588 RepID=UPI00355A606C|nr:hypothetical protein GPJ56_008735 [Histomonas meleagridis]KAH0805472.1 hypothetical protein GO595_001854 [Histomonas meleagridis]